MAVGSCTLLYQLLILEWERWNLKSPLEIQAPVPGLRPGPHQLQELCVPSLHIVWQVWPQRSSFHSAFPVTAIFISSIASFLFDLDSECVTFSLRYVAIIRSHSLSISFSTVMLPLPNHVRHLSALHPSRWNRKHKGQHQGRYQYRCYYIVSDGNCLLRHPLRSTSYYRKLGNVKPESFASSEARIIIRLISTQDPI